MKFFLPVTLILTWTIPRIQAGSNIENSLYVQYRKNVALGEQASLTVTNPVNVFYQLFEIYYMPNGTSKMSSGQGNVPFNLTNGSELRNNTAWTYTLRDDWGPGRLHFHKELHTPNSTGGGWGYQLVLKLFYPPASGYIYGKTAEGVATVVILTPYTTQELRTEIHNFTVQPLVNGATTTNLPSPTSGAPEGSLDGQYSLVSNEKWTFTDQPTGQTFTASPGPRDTSSGMIQVPLIHCGVLVSLLSLVFASLL